jgi:hypothetical protein
METFSVTLNDITFPVRAAPVYTNVGNLGGNYKRITGKKAIINCLTNDAISVVSDNYEIITNKEAYEYGLKCFTTLFKSGKDKAELYNITAPKSGSFCHMDLVNKDKRFIYKSDEFFPFLRITNSYNKFFKLSFRIGVCRDICRNGIILGEESIKFYFYHSKKARRMIDFSIKQGEFERILNKFKTDIDIIKEKTFPEKYSFLLFCKALGLTFDLHNEDENKKEKAKEKLVSYERYFNNILSKYVNQLGSNFYSLFNAITEVGTYGFESDKLFVTKVNSKQTRAGTWLNQIVLVQRKMEFCVI